MGQCVLGPLVDAQGAGASATKPLAPPCLACCRCYNGLETRPAGSCTLYQLSQGEEVEVKLQGPGTAFVSGVPAGQPLPELPKTPQQSERVGGGAMRESWRTRES